MQAHEEPAGHERQRGANVLTRRNRGRPVADGRLLASSPSASTIYLYPKDGGEPKRISHGTRSIALSPDGKLLATYGKLWQIDRPKASREHPTMKPVALFARAIANSTAEGEVVYDPFLGSGTTLVAAEQLGRRCYGIEISPAYVDVTIARWEALTGENATLVKKPKGKRKRA